MKVEDLTPVQEAKRIYLLRLDHRFNAARKKGRVGLGWSGVEGLEQLGGHMAIRRKLQEEMYDDDARRAGSAAGSIRRLNAMQQGDIVIIPVSAGFHVARVESPTTLADHSEWANRNDFRYYRDVTWLTQNKVPRSHAEDALQRWLKSRQTCLRGNKHHLRLLERALQQTDPVDFVTELRDEASKAVEKALRRFVNDRGLEELVARLCRATGGEARVVAKRNQRPGDIDLEAVWDLGFRRKRVAFQVKKHQGATGHEGVEQLLKRKAAIDKEIENGKRMEDVPIDEWCLVTTADGLTDRAEAKAESNNITVVDRNELIDWVLDVGLGSL